MIIQPKPQNNDVVTTRLVTGETIIARLLDEKGDYYTLSKPVICIAEKTDQGIAIYFNLFALGADTEKFDIGGHAMLFKPVKADQNIEAEYLKQTSSIVQ